MRTSRTIFRFGDCCVRFECSDEALQAEVEKRFDFARSDDALTANLADVDSIILDGLIDNPQNINFGLIVDQITTRLCRYHAGDLYVHGTALLSPQGKLVLICGLSQAGKSTLATAMLFLHQWKIHAEDLVFISDGNPRILPLRLPLHLRPGTVERLQRAGSLVPPLIDESWLAENQFYVSNAQPASPHVALYLVPGTYEMPLNVRRITGAELVRELLVASNALHGIDGADRLFELLPKDQCYVLSGGTVQERCDWLSAVAKEPS